MRQSLLLIFILLGGFVSAQTLGDYEEVVYLKNGSVIRGIITETVPNKAVKIQTHENNLFVYQMDEIEKITRELPSGKSSAAGGSRKTKGFNMYFDEGVTIWLTPKPYPMNILTGTPGYKFNRTVFLGVGIGLIARSGFASIPIVADLRLTLGKTKVVPIVNLQVGYMTRNLLEGNPSNEYVTVTRSGGVTFAVKPGIAINLKKDVDLNLNVGYQFGSQIVKTTDDYYYSGGSTDFQLMHFFTGTIGIKF